MLVIFVQFANDDFPNICIPSGSSTLLRDVHPLKADSPIDEILLHIIPVRFEQFKKALSAIDVTEYVIPLEVTDKMDFQIAFSTKYLLEALKSFETNEVTLCFSGEIKPTVITSEKQQEIKHQMIFMSKFYGFVKF